MFQSLTGSIHTVIEDENILFAASFNPSQVQFTLFVSLKSENVVVSFQSLTGSIHTVKTVCDLVLEYLFQSLTGSIHTNLDQCSNYDNSVFQSLTGSIHT